MSGAGDLVGEAHVDIHVNSGPGEAELAAFKAKVDRDFEELGRKKAEASLQLKSTEFDAKIDKAKQELDNLEHRKARASVTLDKGKFDAEIAEAKAEIKALGREKAKVRLDLSNVRDANRETRLLTKGRELDERAALGQAKAERKITQERERATREIQRNGQLEARARAENAKSDASRIESAIKNRAELARLGSEYEKLLGKQAAMEKSSRRVFSPHSLATAESEARKMERVASEADLVKHKIEQLGGSVAHLDPQLSRNSSFLDKWLSRLGDTSIRMGPITTSIKGLAAGLGLLGPILFQLGGGVADIIGFLGSGIAGAAAVGGAGLAGFATSALGVGLVIKPLIKEFGEVKKAEEAVTKAEHKYGKNSEQVKTAQEQLNHELRGVSPVAKAAIQDYGKLGGEWAKMTKSAKPAVFDALGQGIKTVQALLPEFARESVATTKAAAGAWSGWMKSLRSSGAKQILGEIMSNFRASIPALSTGLGDIVAMLGHIAAAASHFLPGLSHGFAEWAHNLEESVGSGASLVHTIGGMVHNMRDFGHLAQDSGSFLIHFFGAAAGAGDQLNNSLDHTVKSWDKWAQTRKGEESLKKFFAESATTTKEFFSVLGGAVKLLFEFSKATAPIATGLLRIVTFIGQLVSAADSLVGVKQIFQGLGFGLAGLFVASKALAFAGTIQDVTRALYGLAAGEEAVAAAQASGGIGGLLIGKGKGGAVATVGEDAAASAGQLELLGAEAGTTGAAMGGAEASAGLLAAALAPEVLIPAAAIAAVVGIGLALQGDARTIEDVRKEFRQAGVQISTAMDESSQHVDQYVASQHRAIKANQGAAQARKRLITLQRENASADKITHAVEQLAAAEAHQTQTATRSGTINRQQIQDQHKLVLGARARVTTGKELIHDLGIQLKNELELQEQMAGGGEFRNTEKEIAKARRELAEATKEVGQAQKQEAVTGVPYERQLKNLKPITQQAEAGLRKLVNTIGIGATKKIGNFVNPQDVQRVTELGNKLTRLGRGSQVKNIAVKSQGADQTIGKLQRLQKQTNRVESSRATIKVGANDTQAQSKLKRLGALSQRLAGTKQTIHILANSNSAEQAINHLRARLTAVTTKQYKAELKAEDKSGQTANNFHHHMQGVASQKYQARITAIDDASSKAKQAEGAAKRAGQQHPKINITASNSQALGAISAVQSSLASLHDKTVSVNVVTHKSGGFSGGPATMYYTNFATGGLSDRELQRANEKAVMRQGGTGMKVNRPTMLVGEQSPQHSEYVIATNPAYRSDNERYLEDAAGEFGYDIVPAYKKGKGGGGKKGGGAPSGPTPAQILAKHPPNPKHRGHKIAKVDHWGPVAAYNASETDAQIKEELYGQLFAHDESEIKAGRMKQWEFGRMRGLLADQVQDYHKIANLVPDIQSTVTKELGRIHGMVDGKGEFSKSSIRKLSHGIAVDKKKLSALKKGKGESDASFRKRKRPLEHAVTQQENEQHKKEKERERLLEIKAEARQELTEVSGARKGNEVRVNAERSEDELQYIADVESGAVEAPYAETSENLIEESEEFKRAKADLVAAQLAGSVPGEESARQHMIEIAEREYAAAKQTASPEDDIDVGERLKSLREETKDNGGKGTLGEQTASYNEAREQLYQQFASNITPTAAPGVPAVGASGGVPSYAPGGGMTGLAAATPALHGAAVGAHGSKVEVVNNFAAPPPDPHTWTRQQEFELGALA